MNAFDMSVPVPHYVDKEMGPGGAREWIEKFYRSHAERGALGLDSETSGIVNFRDVVMIWSISDGKDRLCLDARMLPLWKQYILENPEINFDMSNPKFDAHMFANTGVDISKAGEWRDTVTMSWLHDENNQGRHGLKETTLEWLGRRTPKFEDVFGKLPPKKNGIQTVTTGDLIRTALQDPIRFNAAVDYASIDAYNSTKLREVFDGVLESVEMYPGMNLKQYYYQVEVPFTKVLWKMERRGFTVDAGYLRSLEGPMKKELEEIERFLNQVAGEMLNVNSTIQIRKLFFQTLGKTPIKYTDGGTTGNKQPSTDAEVLEEWAGQGDKHAEALLKHRGISKILGTYVKGLQEWMDSKYRIHTILNQHGTVTGRLSSKEPNLMNIPRPGEDRFKIRESFISGARKRLMVADYGQLEMRLLAHFSGDEKMIKAILENIDLHCLTVAEMYGIPYDDVNNAKKHEGNFKKGKCQCPLPHREEELLFYRQAAKATGFGIVYGIGGPHLAANLTRELGRLVEPEEGIKLIQKWFGVFPGAHRYIEGQKATIDRDGRIQTIMGRFRTLGDVKSMSKKDRAGAHRQGVNSGIQGSAADIAKMAMLKAEYDPELLSYGAEMILQIHDELIWEVPDDPAMYKPAMARAKAIMEDPFGQPLRVPLPVEISTGYSWADAK